MRGFDSHARAMFGPRKHPSFYEGWWTPERDAKLRYGIEHYPDDLDKMGRVLGIPPGARGWLVRRINRLKWGPRA